jgi:flagellar motor switch protein FliG
MVAAAARPAVVENLSPLQKAAILVMFLERDAARAVLQHLRDDEIQRLGGAIAELGELDEATIETVVNGFLDHLQSVSVMPATGSDFARRVLPGLVGEERRGRLEGALRRQSNTEFEDFIRARPARAVAAVLREEHPQVSAVALLRMGPENAASVLGCFAPDVQADLTIRMTRAEKVAPELAEDVEAALRRALTDIDDPLPLGGVEGTARILGRMSPERNAAVIRDVRVHSEGLADDLVRRMVRFEDLGRLDARAVQAVLRSVENADLVLALKGAAPPLRELFLRNLSQRAAQDLREEIELGGPARRSQVREAQDRIVATTRKLADEGVIFLDLGQAEAG